MRRVCSTVYRHAGPRFEGFCTDTTIHRWARPHQVLGVASTASPSEIKTAWQALAKQCHPDQDQSEGAKARFVRVQEAYQALKDTGGAARVVLSDLDQYKKALKDGADASFPEDMWADMKKDHKSKTITIDLAAIDLLLSACMRAGDVGQACALLREVHGMRRVPELTVVCGYNALLAHCEKRMTDRVAAGGAKDTAEIHAVTDGLTGAGLRPDDVTIDILRRTLSDGLLRT
jgi:hypothetical protein